jgi:PAS domain-containing protein
VFENRVLRRIFGPKRDEVTGEWRELHSEELHNLYSSPNIMRQGKSRRIRWAGQRTHMEDERRVNSYGGKVQRKETTRKTEM